MKFPKAWKSYIAVPTPQIDPKYHQMKTVSRKTLIRATLGGLGKQIRSTRIARSTLIFDELLPKPLELQERAAEVRHVDFTKRELRRKVAVSTNWGSLCVCCVLVIPALLFGLVQALGCGTF